MIKVTFEFPSVEEAIVALGKLAGIRGKASKPSTHDQEAARVAAGLIPPPAATLEAAVATATPTAVRKPRADKGQVRGSYKEKNAGAVAQSPTDEATAATQPPSGAGTTDVGKAQEGLANSTSTTPAGVPAAVPAPKTVAQAPATVKSGTVSSPVNTPAATVPTEAEVQVALEAVFNSKGLAKAQEVLSRFGAQRLRDLLPAARADFIALANETAGAK